MTSRTMVEMPDEILQKVAVNAAKEMEKRGLTNEWPKAPAIITPLHGRSASEQLDHARRISNVANHWAERLGWSDDFMLMINVADSTVHTLRFDITSSVQVDTPYGLRRLMKGDVMEIRPIDGQSQVHHTDQTMLVHDGKQIGKSYMKGQWEAGEVRAQQIREAQVRHPFAQPSDVEAILKWEDSQKTDGIYAGTHTVGNWSDVPEAKPALPNAMVVRGGHDSAGWQP